MKTKYRKDRGGLVKAPAKAPKKKKGPSKPKSLTNRGGRWMAEYYFQEQEPVKFEKATQKENIFLTACEETTFVVDDKVKGITLDSCTKVRLYCSAVISVIDMVNCKSCAIYLRGACPSIQIDKSTSPRVVIMTKEAMAVVPTIITSNISAGNIEYLDLEAKEEGIMVEIPMPEQYVNTIDIKSKSMKS